MNGDSMEVQVAKIFTRIGQVEGDVSKLWEKWDAAQKLLIGTMISCIFTLIGVVAIFLKG